ncbi:hypothetical protein F4777DRAFT_585252 [Nemania sp. FL0916]|nr:hypothetical protein F4777DRAFT_585252 [Nemania sp. FL0916]
MDLPSLLTAKSSPSHLPSSSAFHAAFHAAADAVPPSPQQTHLAAKLSLDTSTVHQGSAMPSGSPTEPYMAAPSGGHSGSISPRQPVAPKHVQFELIGTHQYRARIPLRVQIFPHDDTESIISTVKNFHGLYRNVAGISFEDDERNTLIARYENFSNNMVVYVRIIEESPPPVGAFNSAALQTAPLDYPSHHAGHHISRPGSPTSRRRSPSPNGNDERRSTSVSTNPAGKKGRSRSTKNQGSNYEDSVNSYSSGDGAAGSVSGKVKDQIGNTDISVENIVEGGRRKRAKFESSELPLFAPPQMPAATSNHSVSPARRVEHQRPSLPFPHPNQNPFINAQPLQSPQNYNGYGQQGTFATPVADTRHHRGSIGYTSTGSGILPTPDPTIGSCMSEEDKDAAAQLMRLGEISSVSQGRTSASTLDDTFSGKAEVASSTGATSDSDSDNEDDLSPARRQKVDDGPAPKTHPTTGSHFIPPRDNGYASGDDADLEDGIEGSKQGLQPHDTKLKPPNIVKARAPGLKVSKPKTTKTPKAGVTKPKRPNGAAAGPMSPASLASQSRKPSIASAMSGQPGDDEQPDLSTKPRCQRCRKSKKGCDRQRPCGRCRDAGLSADQCISEDEGNGRKGRYGRHMGVPIKSADAPTPSTLLPAPPIAAPTVAADKNKKRKR